MDQPVVPPLHLEAALSLKPSAETIHRRNEERHREYLRNLKPEDTPIRIPDLPTRRKTVPTAQTVIRIWNR